jgi:hypothetical protein
MNRCWFRALVLTFLLCVGWTRLARAAPAVAIVVSGMPDTARSVERVVRELLARHPVTLDWSRVTEINPFDVLERRGTREVLARAWIDLSDVHRVAIYIANHASERFILRIVPLRNGYDEVACEQIAHILESAVSAFLAGEEAGVGREVAEREVARQSNILGQRRVQGALVLGYATRIQADTPMIQHGPALGLAISWPWIGRLRGTLWTSAQYDSVSTWNVAPVGARFEGGTFLLAAGPLFEASRSVLVWTIVGLGATIVRVEPFVVPGAAATAEPGFLRILPLAAWSAGARVRLFGRVSTQLSVGGDIDLTGTRYDFVRGGVATHQLSPWIIRPFALCGLAFEI